MGGGSEADYAQDIARKLIPLLEANGHKAASFAGAQDANSDGANASVAWKPDFSFSIHSDAGYDRSSHNAALMCYQEDADVPYASTVLKGYCSRMGFASRGLQKRVYPNRVAVIRIPRAAGIPAILLEATWHDRDPDATNLRDNNYRQKMAYAMCGALVDYIGGTRPVVEDSNVILYQEHGQSFTFVDVWQDESDYWLIIEAPPNEEIRLFLKPHGGKEIACNPFRIPASGDWAQDLLNIAKTYKVKGSFRLKATCSNNAWWGLREREK
jgi:hypothetical protein